jgi:transposase
MFFIHHKMPTGKYERKPCMKSYGKTGGKRAEILAFLDGNSVAAAAEKFDVSTSTIYKIKVGNWKGKRVLHNTP